MAYIQAFNVLRYLDETRPRINKFYRYSSMSAALSLVFLLLFFFNYPFKRQNASLLMVLYDL